MLTIEDWMRAALGEAERAGSEGNAAVGAVLVKNDLAVFGRNEVQTLGDVTAHAEMVAIRKAVGDTGTPDLSQWLLCTTFEPCPMCCGAIIASGIERVMMGATARQGGFPWRWGDYRMERLLALTGEASRIEVASGVLSEECLAVRRRWEGEEIEERKS